MSAVINEHDQKNDPVQPRDTATRLVVLETRWEDVIPNLATKSDVVEMRGEVKEIKASIRGLDAKIEAQTNKTIIAISGVVIAIMGAIEVMSRVWPRA